MKSLNTIKLQEQADLELEHPGTGEGLGTFFILAGQEHPTRKRLELDAERRLRTQLNKRGTVELEDPEDDHRRSLEFLVSCTLGWYSVEVVNAETGEKRRVEMADFGKGPEAFSLQRVREIYEDKELGWIKPQVRAGLNRTKVFIKDSSRASSSTPAGSPA